VTQKGDRKKGKKGQKRGKKVTGKKGDGFIFVRAKKVTDLFLSV
jgi:hypothetical protein